MIVDIYIGNYKLDTFKDESVELNNSIANVNDITKNTTEYTKSFTVPASHINNKVFKHYYNANIDNTFDARVKVSGRIDLKGIPFKYGKWRLAKVQVKQGKPYAYTINFWGNLVSLKDKFKDDLLSDLDLSAFDHNYNSDNVLSGLSTTGAFSFFSGNMIYNLFSKKQLYYNGIGSDNVNTATLANIAWAGGSNTGVFWRDLNPSIKAIKIIEAIENKYDVTFSRDFFGRTEFTDLFLWLNNGDSIKGGTKRVNFTGGSTTYVNLATDVATFPVSWISFNFRQYFINVIRITPDTGYETVPYTITTYRNGVAISSIEKTGSSAISQTISTTEGSEDIEVYYEITTGEIFSYDVQFDQNKKVVTAGTTVNTTYITTGLDSLTFDFVVSENIPKIKVIDFLSGLFRMFKLVVIADRYDNVYINTLKDYYAQGKLYNFTRYVDFTSNEVERGNLLNQINFNFEEPTTILNSQFKLNTSVAYGDEDLTIRDEDGLLLDGESLEVKVPFEQFIYERLNDLNDNVQTGVMYGGIFNEQIEKVNPAPHLFYNSYQNVTSKPIAFIDDTDTRVRVNFLNTPSHTQGFVEPQYSTIFSEEFNEWDGSLISNTLYTNYYKDYIESIFNIKRRNFTYTAKNVPYRIMTKLQLNDVIQILNNYYRIDNYNFNLLNGDVSLKLINSFDNRLNVFNVDRRQVFVNYEEQTTTVYVTNLANFDYNSTELWVSATASGNVVSLNFDENDTSLDRSAIVTIINSQTLQQVEVTVFQTARGVTFDNNIVTFDSNKITWDNG